MASIGQQLKDGLFYVQGNVKSWSTNWSSKDKGSNEEGQSEVIVSEEEGKLEVRSRGAKLPTVKGPSGPQHS